MSFGEPVPIAHVIRRFRNADTCGTTDNPCRDLSFINTR
jgi:hypothetical protein